MCTSLMAGRKATIKEIIIVSRNEDYTQNNWNKYFKYRPFPEYYNKNGNNPVVSNNTWTLGNGLQVPVPETLFRYNATPDAVGEAEASYLINDHFFFEERGINENNVAISATNSLSINDKAAKADPLVSVGIAECIIPTLLLPQAKTALQTVELLGVYVEKYGASEVNGILIGDPLEAWYFEIGSGHHWIAVKVPDECYIVVANGMRVHGVNLNDKQNIKHSPGLFEFVVQHQLLENPDIHSFNFAEAFGIPGVPYNTNREWLAQKKLTPSLEQSPDLYQYPLFLRPDKAIAVTDIMQVLRATYKGTVLEEIAQRPIGYSKTAESHILTLDIKMPEQLRGTIWQCISTPLGAPYMPLYNVITDIPDSYAAGNNMYDAFSAYWAFRGLYSLVASHETKPYLKQIQSIWHHYEHQAYQEREYLDNMLQTMCANTPVLARDYAAQYSTGITYTCAEKARDLFSSIMTQITQNIGATTEENKQEDVLNGQLLVG